MFRLRDKFKTVTEHHIGCPDCFGKGVLLMVTQKTEPCITCRGTGRSNNARCFVCGGEGTTPITHTDVQDCPTCEGTGQIHKSRRPAYAG